MRAAEQGFAPIAQLLLQQQASLDLQNKAGDTALMVATRNARVEVVKILLAKGADPRRRNQHAEHALMLAENSHQPQVLAAFKDHAGLLSWFGLSRSKD